MPDERDPRTYAIIGAAMEVHRHLGCGFLESVYQDAFAHELIERQIPFRREVELSIRYKGRVLESSFRADFVCFDSVIVELKAIAALTGVDDAQVLNYLKSTGYEGHAPKLRRPLTSTQAPDSQFVLAIQQNRSAE